jgi:hypothetical protein
VRKYLQAYTGKDRAAIERVVDEAFRFSSPRGQSHRPRDLFPSLLEELERDAPKVAALGEEMVQGPKA